MILEHEKAITVDETKNDLMLFFEFIRYTDALVVTSSEGIVAGVVKDNDLRRIANAIKEFENAADVVITRYIPRKHSGFIEVEAAIKDFNTDSLVMAYYEISQVSIY